MDSTSRDDFAQASPFNSSRIFESTPKIETDKTSLLPHNSKKRKAHYYDVKGRKLNDSLLDMCSSTPQASSTLNESLTSKFENFKLENYSSVADCDEPASKFLKSNGCEKLVTPPSTPESHFRSFDHTPRKPSSFQKCTSACSVPSPLKEQHEILYPTLKPLEPIRKPLSPKKFKERIGQNSTPLRKKIFREDNRNLLNKILSNHVIMGHVFEYLSGGDLYRVSMVSKEFRDALIMDGKANERWINFMSFHKQNKENYKITPPSSPESQNLFPNGSISPTRQNFADFVKTGSNLSFDQSLVKCPKCDKPSVVEKSIAQCTMKSCGYIFCQKCDSFGYDRNTFEDKCQGFVLCNSSLSRIHSTFDDLTNSPDIFNNVSYILNSTAENHCYSSGYYSGYDTSQTPKSVKRNLSSSFGNDSFQKPQKVLFDSNRSINLNKSSKYQEKKSMTGSVAPVIKNQAARKNIDVMEPSSPPRSITYSACSKESRRSLKRLTR